MKRIALMALLAFGMVGVASVEPVAIPYAKDGETKNKTKDAAAPAIVGPKEAKFAAVFTVTGVTATDTVFWRVTPKPAETYQSPDDLTFLIAGPADTYTVEALGKAGGKKFEINHQVTLTNIPGPAPKPGPGPAPGPGPGPSPTPGPVGTISRFIVVEDTTKVGQWRGDILGSPKLKSFYRALQAGRTGPIHAIYDVSAPGSLGDEGKKYVDLANGKQLPYIFMLGSSGLVVKEEPAKITSVDDFIAQFDQHVGDRSFGLIIAAPKLAWKEFGAAANVPSIPRERFPKVLQTMGSFLPSTYDQDGIGQCASSAATGVYEFAANLAGLPPVHVSAGDLYRRVNGGRDSGSTLEDNMAEMLANGVAAVDANCPYVWNRSKSYTSTNRANQKFAEVYLCKSFNDAVSAILQGFVVEIGLSWGDNFRPDKSGWLPKKSTRGVGGHALYSYGVAMLPDGTYGLVTRNSWGATFGGSEDGSIEAGSCIIPETLFTGYIGGFYAVRAVAARPVKASLDVIGGTLRAAAREVNSLAW